MAATEVDVATDDSDIAKMEVEVLLAEMETRLRRSVLKVIRPTLDQVTDLSGRLSKLERLVEKHAGELHQSETVGEEVSKLEEILNVVRDRLGEVSQKADHFEGKATLELSDLRVHTFNSEIRLDTAESEIRKIQRDTNNIWLETTRLQQQHDNSTTNMISQITGGSRKTERARDELLERIAEVQRLHYQLVEDLWGDGKVLTQVRVDIQQIHTYIEPIPRLETRTDEVCHKADLMEDSVLAVKRTVDSMSGELDGFKESVDVRLENYDDNSKAVMNQLTAFHASILKSVRSEFNEEIEATKALRMQQASFHTGTRQICEGVMAMVQQEVARLDALHHEVAKDIEGLGHRQKNDQVYVNENLKRFERDTQLAQESQDLASRKLDHLGKVLALVLESEKMANALHIQEFVDRCAECWLGTPPDAKRKPPAAHTAQTLEKWQPAYENLRKGFADDDLVALVPVNMQTGFAKLGYLPGAISYGGKHFDRKGFLLLHHQMLTKARHFLERPSTQLALSPPHKRRHLRQAAPPNDIASEAAKISLQPSAKGGQGGSEVPGPLKNSGHSAPADDFKPDQRSGSKGSAACSDGFQRAACSDGFQRPGSQNQPQAMGSKGSMTGQLGQTTPHYSPPEEPRKLPEIGTTIGKDRVMASTSGETKKVDLSLRPKALTAR